MNSRYITCDHCHRTWRFDPDDSVYLQLDLASKPCPYCEACTLSCRGDGEAGSPHHPLRARRPNPSSRQSTATEWPGPR